MLTAPLRFTAPAMIKKTDESIESAPPIVGVWLALSALMVLAMMLIGAVTRLTESGLSMVEWRPLIGWIPPLSDIEWTRVFEKYRETSQYQLMNKGMSLEEFKTIFFWEYVHRVWGRLIGLVYGLPFFWFLIRGALPGKLKPHCWVLLFLGALQGVIGWWMVKSGFVDRIEVSQYRLAVHLGMAFLIFGYLTWLALAILAPPPPAGAAVGAGLRGLGALAHVAIFTTVLSGALVAGLNAGLFYNDWPLMNGDWIAEDIWRPELGPWNIFENEATVQFDHRMLAYATLICGILLWVGTRRVALPSRARLSVDLFTLALLGQVGLGIATLMNLVPIPLAVMHQGGAATVFALSLWVMRELKAAARPTITR